MERPETYVGAQLGTVDIGGVEFWAMSAEKYVKSAVDNVETALAKRDNRLPSNCYTPFSLGYTNLNRSATMGGRVRPCWPLVGNIIVAFPSCTSPYWSPRTILSYVRVLDDITKAQIGF